MSFDVSKLKAPGLFPLYGALVSIGSVMIILFGLVPYNRGYGNDAVAVFPALQWMWKNTPEWEHCFFVPFICLFLVYHCRNKILESPISPDVKWGGIFIGVSMLCYWVGYKIDILFFSFLTLHLFLGALILWFAGWGFMRAILFPFAFLVFAWPFPFLDAMLAFPLRLIMSEISHIFLNLVGIDNVKVGTAIVSAPDFDKGIEQGARFALDVANPCSGIRSLFALVMVTALYSYFSLKVVWKQWALFLCAAPLAILGNFGRILMLCFGTLLFGSDFAIGTEEDPSGYHMLSGFFVFVVALAGMVGVGNLLQRKFPDDLKGFLTAKYAKYAKKNSRRNFEI